MQEWGIASDKYGLDASILGYIVGNIQTFETPLTQRQLRINKVHEIECLFWFNFG